MSRLSKRHRVLGGVLLSSLAFLASDWFMGTSPPASAKASNRQSAPDAAATAEWEDVSDLVNRLTSVQYASVADELAELDRDLFVPTAVVKEAFPAIALLPAEEEENVPASAAPPPPAFADVHRLSGVMLGANALAVIDNQLVPLRGVVDNHVLVDVQRDYVVLEDQETRERVTLTVERGPVKPQRNEP